MQAPIISLYDKVTYVLNHALPFIEIDLVPTFWHLASSQYDFVHSDLQQC